MLWQHKGGDASCGDAENGGSASHDTGASDSSRATEFEPIGAAKCGSSFAWPLRVPRCARRARLGSHDSEPAALRKSRSPAQVVCPRRVVQGEGGSVRVTECSRRGVKHVVADVLGVGV